MNRINHHLEVLSRQITALEDQGYLEPGRADKARRTIRRMERALKGKRGRRPGKALKRVEQAVCDLVKLITDVNDDRE